MSWILKPLLRVKSALKGFLPKGVEPLSELFSGRERQSTPIFSQMIFFFFFYRSLYRLMKKLLLIERAAESLAFRSFKGHKEKLKTETEHLWLKWRIITVYSSLSCCKNSIYTRRRYNLQLATQYTNNFACLG